MTHRTYSEIGNELSGRWGRDDHGSLDNLIKVIENDERMVCLLASLLRETRHCKLITESLVRTTGRLWQEACRIDSPVSDGVMRWLCVTRGDKVIAEMDTTGLSVRALKALRWLDVNTLTSELTIDLLMSLRNCGRTTANEIMNWANQKLSTTRVEPQVDADT